MAPPYVMIDKTKPKSSAVEAFLEKVGEAHGVDIEELRMAWEELGDMIEVKNPVARFVQKTAIFLREYPLGTEFTPVDEESPTSQTIDKILSGEISATEVGNA